MTFANDSVQPTFAERIGGRWAIALQKWVITLALMPLLAAGYTKNLGDTKSVLLWACFSVAGLCLVGLIDFCLHRTLFRHRRFRPVPMWWVIVNSGVGGLIIGCCAWVGGSLGGVADSTQMAIRIPGLAMLGALWGLFLTLVLEYRDRATSSRINHIDQMVQLELAKMQQSAIVEEAVQSVRDETNREIARIREAISEITELSPADASALIRSSATDAIQPLSRKLWESAENSYPTFQMKDVFVHTITNQPFRPLVLTILTVALSIVDRMSRLGTGRGAVITFLIAAGVMVQLTAVNKLMLKFSHHHLPIFVTAIVVVELQTIALVMWERRLIEAPVSYSEVIVSVAASVFLIFLSVGLYSFDLVSGEVARFAKHGIEAERISSIARDQQIGAALRDMAQVLHGNVQTRLVSCAMALDLAAQANDGESANAALLEARRVLNAGSGPTVISAISLSDEIQRKVSVWSGLCTCNVRIGECSETPEVIDRVGRIVEEGITNAVRHGGATEIDIDIAPGVNNSVDIRITDNGLGLQKGARGVGSAIIENASSGVWGLREGDQGTVLAATVHR